jgi:hypothetical protein
MEKAEFALLLFFDLSYFWNKQSWLRFDLFKFMNKQSSLRLDLFKFLNKQSSLRFHIFNSRISKVCFASVSNICQDRTFVLLLFDIVDFATA